MADFQTIAQTYKLHINFGLHLYLHICVLWDTSRLFLSLIGSLFLILITFRFCVFQSQSCIYVFYLNIDILSKDFFWSKFSFKSEYLKYQTL